MSKPVEIACKNDALSRLTNCFRVGGNNGISTDHIEHYADMLALLSNPVRFTSALEAASGLIWREYCSLQNVRNRFTSSINAVAKRFGFSGSDLKVLTAAAGAEEFGNLIRSRHLWKDSFALGHGEFAHSYQWLAVGNALNWGMRTGELYQHSAGRSTLMPFWVKDDKPELQLRPARLWEYLVDCSQWRKQAPQLQVASDWLNKTFLLLCREGPKQEKTTLWLSRLLTGEITVRQLPNMLAMPSSELAKGIQKIKTPQALLRDHEELFEALAQLLVDQFSTWNALALPPADGGSLRTANNVTLLARDKEDWFISQYENRRLSKLMRSQNEATYNNICDLLRGLPVDPQTQRRRWRISASNLPDVDVTFSTVDINTWLGQFAAIQSRLATDVQQEMRQAFWTFVANKGVWPNREDLPGYKKPKANIPGVNTGPMNFGPPKEGVAPQATNTFVKNITAENGRALLSAMDALTKGRQEHYKSSPKTSGGWTEPSVGIYSRTPNQTNYPKGQHYLTFHGYSGFINSFGDL